MFLCDKERVFLCDKERVFLCDKERVFLCDKERVFFVDAKLHITNGKAAIYCLENRLPVLSCHPGTYYLCKEKCRYCPRIRGIGDHWKVQGHPPTFLGNTNTIGDPTHVPHPLDCQRRDIHSESRRINTSAESGRENVRPDPPKAKRRRIRTVRCRERMI